MTLPSILSVRCRSPFRRIVVPLAVMVTGVHIGCSSELDTTLLISNKSFGTHLLVELVSGDGQVHKLPILPPAGEVRERFDELIGDPCPESLTLRIYLAEPASDGTLTVLASGEIKVAPCQPNQVNNAPVFSAFLRNTDRNAGAPLEGTLLFEQNEPDYIRFDFRGLNIAAPSVDQFPTLEGETISGYVLNSKNDQVCMDVGCGGEPGVGVILWRQYRGLFAPIGECKPPADEDTWQRTIACGTDLNCCCLSDCASTATCCENQCTPNLKGEPIATTVTDSVGAFEFNNAPPGVYFVEVFGDGYLFRPKEVQINAPLDNVIFLVEDDTGQATAEEDTEINSSCSCVIGCP